MFVTAFRVDKLNLYTFNIAGRPTEIPETEVYICESMFDEARQQIVELPRDGLKKFVHSPAVYQDEIYFFRRLINPTKVCFFIINLKYQRMMKIIIFLGK